VDETSPCPSEGGEIGVILCLLTAGIGFIFLIPYMYTAQAHFYEDLKKES
jgi:hypothetical protein